MGAEWRVSRRTWITLVMGLAALTVSPAGVGGPAATTTTTPPVPVVFDTDLDFDDAAALAYLSQEHKMGRIQLRAVTITNRGPVRAALPRHAQRPVPMSRFHPFQGNPWRVR